MLSKRLFVEFGRFLKEPLPFSRFNLICPGLMVQLTCPKNAYKFAKIAYFELKFSALLKYRLYI